MLAAKPLRTVYGILLKTYGPQHWWPVHDRNNPRFEILVGAVLVQHTAWANAEAAVATLQRHNLLTPQALLACHNLPELIRHAGTYHIKTKRLRSLGQWLMDTGGFAAIEKMDTPTLRRALRSVRGIGPETADVIALYAFTRPAFIADAFAFRLFERYGLWQGKHRYEQLSREVEAHGLFTTPEYQEFHALIVAHAKERCYKRNPWCNRCSLVDRCMHGQYEG